MSIHTWFITFWSQNLNTQQGVVSSYSWREQIDSKLIAMRYLILDNDNLETEMVILFLFQYCTTWCRCKEDIPVGFEEQRLACYMRQGPVLAEPKHSPSYPLEAEPVNQERNFLAHWSCKQNLPYIINIINIESQTYRCVQETFMLSWWYLGSICEYNTRPSGKG